jgi:hypothetical protein
MPGPEARAEIAVSYDIMRAARNKRTNPSSRSDDDDDG